MLVIRKVTEADAAEWIRLRLLLWPEHGEVALTANAAEFLARKTSGPGTMPEVVFVAHDEGSLELIGFAEVSRRLYAPGCDSSPVGFLEGWLVVPARQREGVGRALVAAAEAWSQEQGCTEFGSDALAENTLSATAHQALGFEEVEVLRCFRKSLPPH